MPVSLEHGHEVAQGMLCLEKMKTFLNAFNVASMLVSVLGGMIECDCQIMKISGKKDKH